MLIFGSQLSTLLYHRRQCYTTVPTGCHSIPENSLPFYSKTADSEQFYYYPPETQDYIPSTTDDTLDVWSHANFPGLDLGEFPASFQAMISQPSTAQLPVMTSLQASSHSPGAYHVCEWIENNARCGQTISGVMRELSTHLRDAHHIQGNDKKMLVCFWRDCGRELQRGNMKRHVATRHLNVKSPCDYCLKSYSRRDAMKEHARECQGA
ncbi:hypothetical protein K503DRAFT_36649 [Rhizopogon vinicolor AM-OR11-026]|uniref:C2H2-type domain-containing protein n=1 Tax=Rhizopogon vinicolor AM-OR11-026 TaxID=1314800 RepID=A0A1B7N544_9AGAM|nr:hypothetical protein K503DRAFT_36649 [Rhizopogon vinicolor AM-OR11-026]